MCKDSEKDCNTCRHNPGCLKKGLAVFLLFIQTGRDPGAPRLTAR